MSPYRASTITVVVHVVNAALLALIAWIGLTSYAELPARIPIHFGLDGTPDRYTEKGAEWILLFALPFFLTALLYAAGGLTRWIRLNPTYLNIPNKEKFLLLPPEKQEPLWASLKLFFACMSLGINLLFVNLARGMTDVALGRRATLDPFAILPWIVLLIAFVLGYTLYFTRLTNKLAAED